MNDLESCVTALKKAASSLCEVADRLVSLLGTGAHDPEADEPTPTAKPVTLEQVRAVLAEKSRNGYTADVRALLEKHGADKLSAIDPALYAELLSEAEVLGNG